MGFGRFSALGTKSRPTSFDPLVAEAGGNAESAGRTPVWVEVGEWFSAEGKDGGDGRLRLAPRPFAQAAELTIPAAKHLLKRRGTLVHPLLQNQITQQSTGLHE